MGTQEQWLSSLSWEQVTSLNETLCKQQSTTYQSNRNYEAARKLWESAIARNMPLQEVLDLCRRCYEMAPFTFNNGNTFASIGKTLVDDWLKTLPSVEGQIIRNTIGHYIAGLVGRKEVIKVLAYFETSWKAYAAARQTFPSASSFSTLGAAPQAAQNV
jgi:hypothetical protein